MNQEFIQELTIHLQGGQSVNVHLKNGRADRLNPQVEAFLKSLGEPEKREKNFLFQGGRVVLVRLADVSAFEVVTLIRKSQDENGQAHA